MTTTPPQDSRADFEAWAREPAVTTSRVLMTGVATAVDREIIAKWAQWAAANGGSFAVKHEWTENNWYTTWTINWPAAAIREAAK